MPFSDDTLIHFASTKSDAELLRIRTIGKVSLSWLRQAQNDLTDGPELGWDGVP